MTLHTTRGSRLSVKQDDGFGNLITPTLAALTQRLAAGWDEL